MDIEDFDNLKNLFKELGYGIDIKWLRDRKEFKWKDINVCLDYSKGYGYIIELEVMGKEDEKESVLKMLREKFKDLGIEETGKEEFNKAFEKYKKNWKKLLK
jgi:predicted adenylyl cyclase CyaB